MKRWWVMWSVMSTLRKLFDAESRDYLRWVRNDFIFFTIILSNSSLKQISKKLHVQVIIKSKNVLNQSNKRAMFNFIDIRLKYLKWFSKIRFYFEHVDLENVFFTFCSFLVILSSIKCESSLCRTMRVIFLFTICELCRSINLLNFIFEMREHWFSKQFVRDRHVNIIDLIEWNRSDNKYVQIFRTIKKLSDYSYNSEKIYSKQAINELKIEAMLKHLFRSFETTQHWDE